MTKTTTPAKPAKNDEIYFEAVGRRKTAVARVRLFGKAKKKSGVLVNDKELGIYFPIFEHQENAISPLKKTKTKDEFFVSVKISGGGINAQSDAMRLGVSRALLKYDKELRQLLKDEGFLRRDSRAKERRKFGLKKARKAPQWSKR
ncbi:MAG: 30S ribosomal protein S9 [Candidatus Pacebacteria bacterium]|nr:30S ribosomal protein S9 [Candidatus Paceibacterota bacterium]